MPRKKQTSVVLDEDDKMTLAKLAKRHKKDQKFIVGYLISLCDKYNLMAGDWQARLQVVDQRVRYEGIDRECPALTLMDEVWKCVWGRDGKPPEIKSLSKDYDQACEGCEACAKTLKIKLENESYQVKVQELEAKLKEKVGKKFKIAQCNNGARLDRDGLAFEGCPRSPQAPVLIEGYCKKLKNGAGCDWFKSRLVGVQAEA